MFSLGSSHSYFLYSEPVDMRKSFDALGGLVRDRLGKDPASGEVFIFLNRNKNLIKLLHWEDGGLVLYYKRLEKGTFVPPQTQGKGPALRWPELVLMVEGIRMEKFSQKPRFNPSQKASFP